MSRSIEKRAAFDFIRYGSVWEDADVLCSALKPGAKGRRLLSIASAGGNALALLTLDPKEIVAVDLNPVQLACLELRIVAFQELAHEGLLRFLGVSPDAGRLDTYQKLRKRLGPGARDFWDSKPRAIRQGIIHAGKLEKFLKIYQWLLRSLVHRPETTAELLSSKGPAARAEFYDKVWNTRAWRLLNRLAFSKTVLGLLGRDPQFFKHADRDVTSGPSRRLEEALSLRPTHGNPYLAYHLTGNYSASALPLFLRGENFQSIRRRSHRIKLLWGKAEDAPGKFYGFNLSNIFEYMDAEQHAQAYHKLLDKAQPGGRLAYWNLHVRRRSPDSAKKRVTPMERASKSLHAKDQSWAYRSFHIDQVRGS